MRTNVQCSFYDACMLETNLSDFYFITQNFYQ